MKTLIINVDKDTSLKKILDLLKKLKLKSKVLDRKEAEKEHEDWMKIGMLGLAKAYDDDEPDISHLKLKESNPEYKRK